MIRILGVALMAAGSPTALLAYADPGTGILIWQSAIAATPAAGGPRLQA